jgi:hypothetical protein
MGFNSGFKGLNRRLGGPQSLSEEGERYLAPTGFEARTVQLLYRLLHPALHKMLPNIAASLDQYIACRYAGESSTMQFRWGLSNKPTNISA